MEEEMRDTPAMGEGREEGVAYAAGADAPPSPGRVIGDGEVGLGAPTVPVAPEDVNVAADPGLAGAVSPTRPASLTPASTAVVPTGLRTDDGRTVSVVHVVAELAPFARTGGLGEAVKSLAEF